MLMQFLAMIVTYVWWRL